MDDALRDHRVAVARLASTRLGRPLTAPETALLERVTSPMMLEVLEEHIPYASVHELEALLNEPEIPADALGCGQCGRVLACLDDTGNAFDPRPEDLIATGAVAIPNFGWFCSQACGDEYERLRGPRFNRDASGRIRYE